MQLTRHTDYALRVLIFLALQPKGARVTMADIEQYFATPRNHLIKIVQRLGKLGYVDTLRGKGGGLCLGRDAAAITIGEVVRDMESTLDMIDCAKPLCPLHPGCRLKGILDAACQAFIDTLSRYTIADVIDNPESFEAALGWHPEKEPMH